MILIENVGNEYTPCPNSAARSESVTVAPRRVLRLTMLLILLLMSMVRPLVLPSVLMMLLLDRVLELRLHLLHVLLVHVHVLLMHVHVLQVTGDSSHRGGGGHHVVQGLLNLLINWARRWVSDLLLLHLEEVGLGEEGWRVGLCLRFRGHGSSNPIRCLVTTCRYNHLQMANLMHVSC